jgi:hypothetical protein
MLHHYHPTDLTVLWILAEVFTECFAFVLGLLLFVFLIAKVIV